jgi:hypothetical protein
MSYPLNSLLAKIFSNLLALRVELRELFQGQLTVVANAIRFPEHTHPTTAFDSSPTPMIPFEICHEISVPPSAA